MNPDRLETLIMAQAAKCEKRIRKSLPSLSEKQTKELARAQAEASYGVKGAGLVIARIAKEMGR